MSIKMLHNTIRNIMRSVFNSVFNSQSLTDQNKIWKYDLFFLCSELDSFLAVIFILGSKGRIQNPLKLMEVFPPIFSGLWSSFR